MLDITTALAPERAALLHLLTSLYPDDWARPTECPGWTVRDLALHILGDDLSLLSRQRDAEASGLFGYAESHPGLDFMALLDGFNEQWVTAASFLSPALIVELLRVVGTWCDDFYGAVDLTTISREPIGYFRHPDLAPYWMLIAREYVERVIHQTQIRRAIGAPDLPPEVFAITATVVAHAAVRALPDRTTGTTVAVDLGSTGSWAWQRVAGDAGTAWRVVEASAVPDARITIDPADAVAVLTRGVHRPAEVVTVAGDEDLAAEVLAAIDPLLARP
ncbi:MAG: maleylpyruvate isomerase family mycothiol-dependent enzyme [Actinomycetota bacterium]